MNFAEIRKFDVSNGPNVRTTLFVSGCTNNCKGCFNKELQDFSYGKLWTKETEEEFLSYVKNNNVFGVNILGGEPMEQTMDNSLVELLDRIKKETNKPIWLWSGYLYDIDGRFEIDKRNISLKYRGSFNQRVIDIKKSRIENKVVEIDNL